MKSLRVHIPANLDLARLTNEHPTGIKSFCLDYLAYIIGLISSTLVRDKHLLEDGEYIPFSTAIMGEILKEYKLIEIKLSQNFLYGTEKSLTMNGIRALTAGGVREYMIDTDPAIVIHDGYPMVVSVITKDGFYLSKHLINSSAEYAAIMEHYENEDVHYNTRTSHRSNGQIMMQIERPVFSPPQPSPPQITNYFHNHIQGSVDNIIQDSIENNSGSINVSSSHRVTTLNRAAPNGKKRSWLEWLSWIFVILGTIVAIIMAVYEIYFKK